MASIKIAKATSMQQPQQNYIGCNCPGNLWDSPGFVGPVLDDHATLALFVPDVG